ncbi:hypothetical protein D0Y65_015582 [Glycine soja]|uniref:Membrane-associated kinase regulator 1 n=1 Tax=Glycine soja TaxID=3848 RepID=A0A445KDZ9_GLYSO|nr:hypothetical protein D0Y65_015582 [Glycine soja]
MNNTTHHKKPSSGDSFSFPSTPTPDSADFEFGSLTPDSSSTEPFAGSPADHLFFNGRLQPHYFPITSRTSSTRDSLFSSRSNSTNSSCSSARTSSSDSSERKAFHNKHKGDGGGSLRAKTQSHNQAYCSQRWQYITPVPTALSRDGSVRKRRDTNQGKKKKKKDKGSKSNNNKNKDNNNKNNKGVRLRFGKRILRWFLMACRECHAMEPSSKGRNKEIVI